MKVTDVIKDLSIIERIYDTARLVNPYTKTVHDTIFFGENKSNIPAPLDYVYCYHAWKRNEVCENCISARTIQDKKTHVKIEFSDKEPFLVTTMFVQGGDDHCVLELIRKIDIVSMNIIDRNLVTQLDKLTAEVINDPLTGAYNRKFINEQTPYLLAFYKTRNKNFAYIICDIDDFKCINTKYGHVGGDYVLKAFVQYIKKFIRTKSDWIARYGVDEFIIYLDDANIQEAKLIIDKIKDYAANTPIIYNEHKISFTASYGISTPTLQDTPKTILEKADTKLYKAKKIHKNKVAF